MKTPACAANLHDGGGVQALGNLAAERVDFLFQTDGGVYGFRRWDEWSRIEIRLTPVSPMEPDPQLPRKLQ